jgi:hypothetical protein
MLGGTEDVAVHQLPACFVTHFPVLLCAVLQSANVTLISQSITAA